LARNCKIKSNKPTKTKHKILNIGDSHARWIAFEIRHNLDNDWIQGIVKPGSDLAVITHTANRDISTLIKQDFVVLSGGTRDVGRNESQKGLCKMRNFVERHIHTNVLVGSRILWLSRTGIVVLLIGNIGGSLGGTLVQGVIVEKCNSVSPKTICAW
jgi:hypothetical protein